MPSTHAAIVLSDNFSYSDGSLTNMSSLKWTTHSGTGGQVDVAGGKMNLTQAESEDVNALLEGQPYATNSTAALYAKFTANFSALPAGASGGYFAHFKDGTVSGFRARVFALTNGAAAGAFRLAIAAAAGTNTASVPIDLNLNTDYTVVVRYTVGDATCALWVNPTSESDASAVATDSTTTLPIASFAFRQSLASGNGMGTLQVDNLVVATTFAEALAGPITGTAPAIVAEPADLTVTAGSSASFNVTANGTEPLSYLWRFTGGAIGASNAPVYTIVSAQTNNAGGYSVVVTNNFGSITSRVATLTVNVAPPPGPTVIATNIAYLRTLVDPQTYAPTDTTNLYSAEGIVTTYVNLTTAPNASFYMQDGTAGIDVFFGGSTTIRPNAGDRVRVTGPLGHFNGLLEFNLTTNNPAHAVVTLSTNNPLPAPKPLAFSLQNDPTLIEPLEGSLVVVSNVFLDVTQPNFPSATSGGNVNMTNELGEIFVLRVDTRVLDITSQPKPTGRVSVIGVLAQFDSSSPYTTGYQLTPTRFADIVGAVAAPKIEFTNNLSLLQQGDAVTNTFTEHVLRVGEQLTIRADAYDPLDPLGRTLRDDVLTPGTNQLSRYVEITNPIRGHRALLLVLQATTNNLGKKYTYGWRVDNTQATNTATWTIYVPTVEEQKITIGEFLANAPGTEVTPYPNILNRPGQPPAQNSDDEFVELVNLNAQNVDLLGWTISDSVQVRHKFYDAFSIGASNSVVVYGGPLNGFVPQLDVPVIPASENAFGFGLNNTGGDSIWLRNAQSNLIARVVYSVLPTNGTMTRFPDMNGNFVGQLTVSTNSGSPGRQFDGKLFSEPPPIVLPATIHLAAALEAGGAVRLRWNAEPARSYTVLFASRVGVGFVSLASGLIFPTSTAEYLDTGSFNPFFSETNRFYLIRTP